MGDGEFQIIVTFERLSRVNYTRKHIHLRAAVVLVEAIIASGNNQDFMMEFVFVVVV